MRSKGLDNSKAKYKQLRKVVYEFTEAEFPISGLTISEITFQDALEADKWGNTWKDLDKVASWEWQSMYKDYQSNAGSKRFDIAFKVNGKICALCYGVPTKTKMVLKIHALERKPNQNPLQGQTLKIILFAAEAYATLLGSKELWLCNPMNQTLVGKYQKAGFDAHTDKAGYTSHLSLRIK